MEWTADVAAGDWLRERIDDPWQWTIHDVVPRGFEAYARVFHPASVQSVPGGRMPTFDEWHAMTWEQHEPLMERIEHGRTTWLETAAAFGTVFHAQAQWSALAGEGQTAAPDGRWFDAPMTGEIDAESATALATVLAAHTATPGDGHVALWEGFGGLLGHMGTAPSRAFIQFGTSDPAIDRHNRMLGSATKDVFNNVFRKNSWQDGILSREISDGPRLALPGRDFVLFRGGIAELAGDDWHLHVPWRDRVAEEHGFEPSAQSPSIVWPADRAWTWVTEVDYDSTIVGGSRELVAALVADPRLEALEIPAGCVLTVDSDEVNR